MADGRTEKAQTPLHCCSAALYSVQKRGVRMLHLPYSASNACFKGKLHLVLAISFPLNRLPHVIPQTMLFIRCRSGLSTSICGWESSAHLAARAEHREEMLLLFSFFNTTEILTIIHLCKPCTYENGFSEYLFPLYYWFFTLKVHHLWLIINPSEYSERFRKIHVWEDF